MNDLQEIVISCLKAHNISFSSLVLCKRNRDLKDGDMIVPKGLTQPLSDQVNNNRSQNIRFICHIAPETET